MGIRHCTEYIVSLQSLCSSSQASNFALDASLLTTVEESVSSDNLAYMVYYASMSWPNQRHNVSLSHKSSFEWLATTTTIVVYYTLLPIVLRMKHDWYQPHK